MSQSVVDICNSALAAVGSKAIVSLSDNTERARILQTVYNSDRLSLLRMHPWNFAIKQATLPLLDGTIPFEYAYAYELPADCLRILRVFGNTSPYEVLGRAVYSNDDQMRIYYVADITDTAQFDPVFIECLAMKIASDIAYSLTQNLTLTNALEEEYEKRFRQAKQYDAQEGSPRQWDSGTWLESRLYYTSGDPLI